jgi:RNA polymerase sigma-70 factor (ECF subfamily)
VTSRPRATDTSGDGRPLEKDAPVPGADAKSFDAFYAREYRSLVALAHALTGSRSHAEDIAQEAMLAAYRRWDGVALLDSPAGWVRRVCANISTSFVRRRVVEARAAVRMRSHRTEVTELEDDDAEFWSVVRRLPRRQRQCVALRYVCGYTVAEIAIVLGCADGTVKAHLARARSALAQQLGEPIDEEAAP